MSSGKKIHTPKFAKKKKAKQQHMDGSVGQWGMNTKITKQIWKNVENIVFG
jgi:hypothetical protein